MPTLQPAEFDNSPVSKQSIIQAPIMYPVIDAPAPPMMVDYLGAPPSSGAKLATDMAPASSMGTEMPMSDAPAPATSLDYAAAPGSAASMLEMMAPPPDWAYSTPSSRMDAPPS
jgi:hypothetical protein